MTATTPPLPADRKEGLRRLKMAAMRRLAPELLVTAKTQRWNDEFLRTLIEAVIASRDESNVPHPDAASSVPRRQAVRGVRRRRVLGHLRRSTTSQRWSGSVPRRTRG